MKRKNLFTVNIDAESAIDHEALILRTESAELHEKREILDTRLQKTLKKSVRKTILPYFIAWVAVMAGVMGAWRTVTGWIETQTLSPFTPALTVAFFAVALVFFLIHRHRERSEAPDPAMEAVDAEFGKLNDAVRAELGVPADAPAVEVFTEMYSEEDEEEPTLTYVNDETYVFLEEDRLCFWYGAVIAIPLASIEGIVRVRTPVTFESWGKDEPFDGVKYLSYGIRKNEIDEYDENYTVQEYFSLRFTYMDEAFEVILPPYDIDPVARLLGTEITEE